MQRRKDAASVEIKNIFPGVFAFLRLNLLFRFASFYLKSRSKICHGFYIKIKSRFENENLKNLE